MALLAIATLILSTLQITSEWRFWGYDDLAARIANGANPAADDWLQFDALLDRSEGLDADCNFQGVRARLSVSLARYDSAVQSRNAEDIDRRRANAIAAAEQNIRCSPLDGNAWFRRALLEVSVHGLTDAARNLFQIADRYAPSEGALMRIRIPLYAAYVTQGHVEYRDQVIRDIANYTAFALDPNHVLVWCGAWPDLLCTSVKEGFRYLTVRQRNWYFAVANNLGIDLGQPRNETVIVDPFSRKPINKTERLR